jgi:hypothetical protein
MYDAGKIIAGLIAFLVLATFPIWYGVAGGAAAKAPDPKIITTEKDCVAATAYMKTNHMDMLNQWRETVVREGRREYVSPTGRKFEMSLSNTCMSCHSNKSDFCDQCHNYMGVTPYCWDCHIEPKEVQR